MCYIYVDGDVYLGWKSNAYVPVSSVDAAKKFESEKQAQNILRSCVPKIVRDNYMWKILEVKEDVKKVESIVEVLDKNDDSNNESKPIQYINIDIEELKTSLNELAAKFSAIQGNKEWLLEQESDIDKQISDILHWIEFNTFDACTGYKMCRVLKNLRLQRRRVKNELELINIINCHTCNNIAKGNTKKAIDGLDNKQYKPRVLEDLFDKNDVGSIFYKKVHTIQNNIN